MSAFAAAMNAIFADRNMAAEATWTPQGGAPLPVRVIRKAPDELISFGAARIMSDTTLHDSDRFWPNPAPWQHGGFGVGSQEPSELVKADAEDGLGEVAMFFAFDLAGSDQDGRGFAGPCDGQRHQPEQQIQFRGHGKVSVLNIEATGFGVAEQACLKTFPGSRAKREPLTGTLYMPDSGGGWIVTG